MISDNIQKRINEAMKSGDKVRLETLKMLSSSLTNAEIENKRQKLTKDQETRVVQREAKKRKDAIEAYKKAGAKEKADKEQAELEILQEYLPKEMSDEEVNKIVNDSISQTGAKSMADMGKVMGTVMAKVKGRADGEIVSKLVKQKLG